MNSPKLIVMLTHNDHTIENAREIFESCKNTKAEFWGFKEKPLPISEMKSLFSEMKSYGKTTFLEVVEYDEEGHKYKHKKDKEREEEIKSILKCTFIRCDYRISDIKNVMIILKHLFNFNVKEKDNEKM